MPKTLDTLISKASREEEKLTPTGLITVQSLLSLLALVEVLVVKVQLVPGWYSSLSPPIAAGRVLAYFTSCITLW